VEVWQTSSLRPLRLGEEKRKKKKERNIETTGQKYNGLPYYIGRPSQTKARFGRLLRPPAWKRSGTILSRKKGRGEQKKKIGKANEKKEKGKVKRAKDEEVNGQG